MNHSGTTYQRITFTCQMEMLLAAGADAELRSTDGSAADDWAMRFGHAEAAELVRQHRESMNRTQEAVASAVALSKYQVAECVPCALAMLCCCIPAIYH